MLHLHHLTPIHEAAERAFPDVPRIGHLHGTELLMLREIDAGPPPGWEHAAEWAERMRRWARGCERLLVLSPDAVRRVPGLLGVDPERVVWAPNGFDPVGFDRRPLTGAARLAHWRRWLVEEPRGWDEAGEPGSVAYTDAQLEPFAEGGPVLLYVGRFTEVKRVPLLVRAHARARDASAGGRRSCCWAASRGSGRASTRSQAVRETGDPDVFLAGWRGHEDLPDGLNAADLLVLPSVHEQFGAVIVEAMACGLPALAVDAHGPAEIVDAGETGWLVPPDDEAALAEALVEAVDDDAERRRRGGAAYEAARGRYSWPALARGLAERVRGGGGAATAVRGRAYPRPRLDGDPVPHPALGPSAARPHPGRRGRGRGRRAAAASRCATSSPFVEEKRAWIERTLARMRETEAGAAAAAAGGRRRGALPRRAADAAGAGRAQAQARARGPARRRAARWRCRRT